MRRVWALAVAVFVLSACSGREHSPTSAYGSGVITGEVVMSEGVSAAGVVVSVRGTGMTKLLAADGQFAFAGVPDGAELSFERAADGIDATLKLEMATGHVVVDLAKTEAKKSGRRRAAGSSKTYEFEGVLTAVSATQIVMNTSREQGVTINLNDQTVIRRGGTALTAADLAAGMRVHVKAIQSADAFVATSVTVQNDGTDDSPPQAREYEGIVVSASATELVIFSSKKENVTFVVDATTEIRKGNTPIAAADIQAGWRVHVKTDGTSNTARLVIVQNTR